MATLMVDDEKPFISDDWIGKGKSYSGDLPGEVLQAKITAFMPPEPAVGLVPAGSLPVMEFAAIALPRQSSELAYGESRLWFSALVAVPLPVNIEFIVQFSILSLSLQTLHASSTSYLVHGPTSPIFYD
ncbi:hypothetical protein B0H10DRAFT_2235686 [Mycena sp. CBHHK59/15]|nr:hypothetical protein B0H10DRAFT_2235686 [Mycena sp. CBHHK59/15]